MAVKVYVISDSEAINYIVDNDIEGFKNYLAEEEYIRFDDPEVFNSEQEALAFCAGLGYGIDERAPIDRLPLRSSEDLDRPFIETIENY